MHGGQRLVGVAVMIVGGLGVAGSVCSAFYDVPDIDGVPLGSGWCTICGRDQPFSHDFTHGLFSGGNGSTGNGSADRPSRPGRPPRYDRDAEARKHYNLAVDHFNAGRWEEALKAAYQATQHKWEYARAHYLCGRAIHLLYSDYEARGIEHLAVNWRRDAANCYRSALEQNPDMRQAATYLAQLGSELAAQERRRQELWEAAHPEIKGDRAYNRGMDYLDAKQWQEAERAFRLALSYNARDHEAWWKLGYVLLQQDRLREAVDAYRRGIELNADEHTAHAGLAWLFNRLGRYEEAVASAGEAIRLSPDNAYARRLRARAYWRLGDLTRAEADYRDALERDATLGWVYDNLGSILQEQGKHEQARDCFLKALELDPSDTVAQYHLDDANDKISFAQWAAEHERERPNYVSSVQNTLSELVHSDTSVVDLRDVSSGVPTAPPDDAGAAAAPLSLKLVDVPSPSGYKSQQERRRALAKLTDAQIDREIERMRGVLERMKSDFLAEPQALEKHLQESQAAEREALMACFQTLLSGSIKKWEGQWDKYPKAKQLAEQGLRYLSYEQPVKDWLNDPTDLQTHLELSRNHLLELYDLIKTLDPEAITDAGLPAAALASFAVDYSYQVSRWAVAREQIRILTENLDKPNGKLDAQQAIGRLYEDMIQERNRRQAAAPVLMPKGVNQ